MGLNVAYKGQQIAQLTEDGNLTLETAGKYCEDDIELVYSGGGSQNPVAVEDDVIFIDYDGTIRYSYSTAEFLALTEMPPNPVHSGLTAQGWNWTLAGAKAFVATHKFLVVGQSYITTDGATKIYVNIPIDNATPLLGIGLNGSAKVSWGDGSSEDITGASDKKQTFAHTFANAGDYCISIKVNSGSIYLKNRALLAKVANENDSQNLLYYDRISKVEVGNNCILNTGFARHMHGLKTITLPTGCVPSDSGSNTDFFASTYSLKAVVFPFASQAISLGNYHFDGSFVHIVSIPEGVISLGTGFLRQCYALKRTNIISDWISFTCNNNTMISRIAISGSPTAFSGEVFNNCSQILSLTVPSTVETLGNKALRNLHSLQEIYFTSSVPPTAQASDTFQNLPADCVIHVPSGSLSDYIIATNYPDPNTYTYVEDE